MRISEADFANTVDLVHEAALDATAWTPVLHQLARLMDCVAAGLTVEDPGTGRGTPLTYFGFDQAHVERNFDHYLPLNPLFGIAPKMQPGFVVANGDVIPTRQFCHSEFYFEWARPQGLCSPITLVLHRTATAFMPLTLVRPDGSGEASQDDRDFLYRLAPHLLHAARVCIRVAGLQDGGPAMTEMFARHPDPAFLLDGQGRITFANPAAEALLADPSNSVLTSASGALAARDPALDTRIQAAVALALGSVGRARSASAIRERQPKNPHSIDLTVTPLGSARNAWAGMDGTGDPRARCVVIVHGYKSNSFFEQFGLTPAEQRVLDAVLSGQGLGWAAQTLGISRATAKSHLDKIFQKTNTHRQTELLALAKGR